MHLSFTRAFASSSLHPRTISSSMSNSTCRARARLKGVVFDMDGTLTVPVIDFAAMYRAVLGDQEYLKIRAQNPSGIDILHHIEGWTHDRQLKAYDTIAEFERRGLELLQIMPDGLGDGTTYGSVAQVKKY